MKTRLLFALLVTALINLGCQTAATSTGSGTSTSTQGDKTVGEREAQAPQTAPAPVLPEELKTAAYHWYGLGHDKAVTFAVSASGRDYSGTQTVKLKSVENGKATFEIERDGELGDSLGTDTVQLDKTGVYITKNSKLTPDTPNLDMPSDVAPGKTWTNNGKGTMEGQSFEQHLTLKAVREETVPTKAGSQKALLVTSNGQVTVGGKRYRMDGRSWYVKDKGLVKNVLTLKNLSDPKEKPNTVTIQESK